MNSMVSLKSATERNQFHTCTEMKAKTLIYLREVSLLPVKKKKKKKPPETFSEISVKNMAREKLWRQDASSRK